MARIRKTIVIFFCLLATLSVSAQQTDYNKRGDEAKDKGDYGLAKMEYELGIPSCDPYSIQQLTEIWKKAENIRGTVLSNIMIRCQKCLDDHASNDQDTTSMVLLIEYYEKGIGTPISKEKADIWKKKLEQIRNPYPQNSNNGNKKQERVKRERERMRFFAGFSGSYYIPYGLTVGGVAKIGWYLRFRTNFSSQNYTHKFDDKWNILPVLDDGIPNFYDNKKTNVWAATGGMVFRVASPFYISFGGGYCRRETLYQFEEIGKTIAVPQGVFWAKCLDETSFEGVALDLDGAYRIGKTFYL